MTDFSKAFAPILGAAKQGGSRATSALTIVAPIPAGAPEAPATHPRLGKPTAVWIYDNAAGRELGRIHRYETPEGKEFRPLTLWRPVSGGQPTWRWESWPAPRPLYGLHALATNA